METCHSFFKPTTRLRWSSLEPVLEARQPKPVSKRRIAVLSQLQVRHAGNPVSIYGPIDIGSNKIVSFVHGIDDSGLQ